LDIQRILHFGRPDGTLDERPQRRVITLTDAIVAGEGEGPLAPSAIPLGMLTLGSTCAAVDWVHAILMGFDPQRIPLLRQAFSPHRYPLATFSPHDIKLEVDGEHVDLHELFDRHGRLFLPPAGWVRHCELTPWRAIHVQ
ncbi:MAG TPA: hypothetical protein VJY33_11260, partial [Isosphaeraceae bacterium]|nr:hypothetical protein [Isosphaeraceae bacterium]